MARSSDEAQLDVVVSAADDPRVIQQVLCETGVDTVKHSAMHTGSAEGEIVARCLGTAKSSKQVGVMQIKEDSASNQTARNFETLTMLTELHSTARTIAHGTRQSTNFSTMTSSRPASVSDMAQRSHEGYHATAFTGAIALATSDMGGKT